MNPKAKEKSCEPTTMSDVSERAVKTRETEEKTRL